MRNCLNVMSVNSAVLRIVGLLKIEEGALISNRVLISNTHMFYVSFLSINT